MTFKKNRVLFIEQLGLFSFIISLLLKPYFSITCYRKTSPFIKTKKFKKLLEYLDYKWISYLNLNGGLYVKSFPLKISLTEKTFTKVNNKSNIINRIIYNYNLNEIGKKKLNTLIKNKINTNNFDSGVSSIPLLENFFPEKNYLIIFFPKNYNDYINLKNLNISNIKINGFHALILLFYKILYSFYYLLINKCKSFFIIKKKAKNYTLDSDKIEINETIKCSIGFFPHENIYYGDHYKKDYLYSNNPDSVLYKKNILTFFFNKIDSLSKKYLDRNQIPYLSLKNYSTNLPLSYLIKKIYKIIRFNNFIGSFFSLEKFFWNVITLEIIINIEKQILLLNHFSDLKLIYVHYDVLFPQDLLLACHINGIETISMQERSIQYLYFPYIFFDHYLINGIGFESRLKNNGYFFKKSHVVGLPRSILFEHQLNNNLDKYKSIKESFNLVLCFGLFPISDDDVGDYGEDGTSMKSTISFLKTIYKLSENYKDSYFLIKFKMNEFLDELKTDVLIKKINDRSNIEIVKNLDKVNSYEIAALSNIIIGKQTSIMEEAFSIEKKIIFYDDEKYLQAYDYPLNKFDIVFSSYQQLEKKFKDIIYHNKYIEPKQLQVFNQKYFNNSNIDKGFEVIRKKVADIYNLINN